MSVAIATMGMFTQFPCGGGESEVIERLIDSGGGGSSYGWEKQKPQIIINSILEEEKEDIYVKIIGVYYD